MLNVCGFLPPASSNTLAKCPLNRDHSPVNPPRSGTSGSPVRLPLSKQGRMDMNKIGIMGAAFALAVAGSTAAYAQGGAATGAATGAVGGAIVGGPVGAAVGAGVGAVAGGIADETRPRFRTYV